MDLQKLVNKEVEHVKYGKGIVAEVRTDAEGARRFVVRFGTEERKFGYPAAFANGFLRMLPELEAEINEDIEAVREAERIQAEIEERQHKQKVHQDRPAAEHTNLAFKCNFCDGGQSNSRVGFCGVCSGENIRRNIEVNGHSQCKEHSKCAEYLRGECSYADVVATPHVCYESEMLETWRAAAGMDLRGVNANQGRRIADARQVELVALTTRFPGEEESKRVIFAVFLADESSSEAYREEAGYVQSNDAAWRIELTPQEARKMLFWNYYSTKNGKEKWAHGLYRYISNEQAINILTAIVSVKTTAEDKAHAQAVLNEYKRRIQ